ncbi:MAG: phosphodiesterase [Niameybacter sp.]|uniref:phosphodiesterase n=1 Tax=Niameybacter sp. TaxID=2033640 RepID=UPI002FCAF6E0
MKYLIFSDIHGSSSRTQHLLDVFKAKQCDLMLILGDVLYHGPRNPLPEGHNPGEVVQLLNDYKEKIICVGGNCDTTVDQMVLSFPCLAEYTIIMDEGIKLFATHGHHYQPSQLPLLNKGDVFLYGHTHLWEIEEHAGIIQCNPGSISLPKEGRPATYAIYEKGQLEIFTLEGESLKRYQVKSFRREI